MQRIRSSREGLPSRNSDGESRERSGASDSKRIKKSSRTVQTTRVDVQAALRSELGDAEYERYLTGTGRPTEVQVMDVLASSPAEKAGLQPGDQIVSYAGTRVYDMRELEGLTRQGTPGESVTVEVKRNGQSVQVQVQRGVLGVEGGGRGGPPGGRGPGGFGRP